jgi:hypothetical protein
MRRVSEGAINGLEGVGGAEGWEAVWDMLRKLKELRNCRIEAENWPAQGC